MSWPIHIDEWWEMATAGEKNLLIESMNLGSRMAVTRQWQEFAEAMNTAGVGKRYSENMGAAWWIHMVMCQTVFSARQRYLKELQVYAWEKSGMSVSWPDVLIVLRDDMPDAICFAAVKALGVTELSRPIAAFDTEQGE